MTPQSSTLPRPGAGAHDLRAAAGSFLGRAEEIDEVAQLLVASPLVTLTGAPGIGKSRLALEVARGLDAKYPDGAPLVRLAPVSDPALVPGALASALGVAEAPGQSLTDMLVARLHRRRLLVVLDNCEHLLGACAKLADALLSGCPNLRILATSREPLQIPAETAWQVPALPVPDFDEAAPEALESYASVRLFAEHAAVMQPGFALNPYVAPAVGEICRRLDGIPLAIELAAARVEFLTPAEIARRLDDRFGLLANGSRTDVPHHETLLAALEWSHELLSEPERALLRRLSVFVGGFELEAAEAVCSGGDVEPGEVFDLLGRLVAKSLVVSPTDDSPRAGYHLLETIRAYARDRLAAAGEAAALRSAHARWCLALAEQAEPELTGPSQERWLERLESERENLRAGLEWSLGHGETECALGLAGALVLFWRVRCHFSEGRELLDAVVSASDGAPAALRAKVLWGAGFVTAMVGDFDGAVPTLEESLARFRELRDPQGCARALLVLGNCAQFRDDPSAHAILEESADLARRAGDSWCLAHALGVDGLDYGSRDELPAARPLFVECLAVAREAEDKQGLRLGLFGLGSVALRQGDFALAESLLEEAVAVTEELGEDYSKATALQYLGELAIGRGEYGRAAELLHEALALFRGTGPPNALPIPLALRARAAYAHGDRTGARRLLHEALALARAGNLRPDGPLQGLGELAFEEGKTEAARDLLEEALALARADGDKGVAARTLRCLGWLARDEGEVKRAAVLHNEALQIERKRGSAQGIVVSLEAAGGLAAAAGRYENAARLLGAAEARREANGYARLPWESSRFESDLALVREGLSTKELEAAFAKGAALSLEEAAAEASKGPGPHGRRPTSGWSSLTASERHVAALVAQGLSNPEVADCLFISRGTVKFHMTHVFRKLGVAGRVELAREVWRREQEPVADR